MTDNKPDHSEQILDMVETYIGRDNKPVEELDEIYPVYRLKTDPEPFQKVKAWKKTGEVRNNDRDFQVGGILILEEHDRKTGQYTNDAVERKISDVTPLDDYGAPGQVLISFDLQNIDSHTKELREELLSVSEKADTAETQVDDWMEKCEGQQEEIAELASKLSSLQVEVDRLTGRLDSITRLIKDRLSNDQPEGCPPFDGCFVFEEETGAEVPCHTLRLLRTWLQNPAAKQ
jgi:hypothetical protein